LPVGIEIKMQHELFSSFLRRRGPRLQRCGGAVEKIIANSLPPIGIFP
jgi:hypothetical protein